jgi:hypothetical protein
MNPCNNVALSYGAFPVLTPQQWIWIGLGAALIILVFIYRKRIFK